MESIKTPSRFIIFLVLFEFNVYMANDLIMPSMINVVREFASGQDAIPLSLSLYLLGGVLLQVFIGPISDKIGRRPVMLFGCTFFALCTLVIALSRSMYAFLVARCFQGMGLCFIGVCGYTSIQELFEEKKAVRVIAWMTSVSVTAPLLGPIFGGFFADTVNWRWIFAFTLVAALASIVGLYVTMPETVQILPKPAARPKRRQRIRRALKPMLESYRNLLQTRKLVAGGILSGLLSAPVLCWIAVSPIVLFETSHIEAQYYGLVQIPIFTCFIFGNYLLRGMTLRYSLTRIILIGTPIHFLGLLLLPICSWILPTSYWSLILPLSLSSVGCGIISAPLIRQALYSSEESKGIASAVHNIISTSVLAIAVTGIPLVFKGKNMEFSAYSMVLVLLTAISLAVFIKDKEHGIFRAC